VQPSPPPEFLLHPHYRSQLALEATLRKTEAGSDNFITEKYAHQIQVILDAWSSGLRESPQSVDAFEKVLADDFSGLSFTPSEPRKLRSGAIEIWKNSSTGAREAKEMKARNRRTIRSNCIPRYKFRPNVAYAPKGNASETYRDWDSNQD
jgi:hypothetical protein